MSNLTMVEIAVPDWMARLFESLDGQDFSPGGGLSIFALDATMVFGDKIVASRSAIAQFFREVDGPVSTKHTIGAVWRTGDAYVMQGHAEIVKKGGDAADALRVDPLFNIVWLNEDGQIERYVVSASPRAAARFPH